MENLRDILTRIRQRQIGCGRPNSTPAASQPETCETCAGLGLIVRDVRFDDPDFGRLFPCRCQQSEARRAEKLRRYANIPHPNAPRSFRNFEPVPGTQAVLAAAREFAAGATGYHVLTLVGRNGCGKSHLLEAVAWEVLARGVAVKYEFCPALLDALRNSYNPEAEASYERVYQRYAGAEMLILDDLGAGKVTPWVVEKLEMLVDEYYRNGRPLAVATNLTLDGMAEKLGYRIADRVYDTHSGAVKVVVSDASSYRTGKTWGT